MFNISNVPSIAWSLMIAGTIFSSRVIADGNQTEDLDLPSGGPPIFCDQEHYGTPDPEDCKTAMTWIPYYNLPRGRAQNEATAFRTFAEPQFLAPPFSPVKNEFAPRAIVQMPKIWKHETCTIAILLQPYEGVYTKKVKPVFKAKWADVGRHVDKLVPCLEPRGGGPAQGGYAQFSLTNSAPAGVYIYTTDSAFNQNQMAQYVRKGEMIIPTFGRYGAYVSASNSSSEEGPESDEGYSIFNVFNSTTGSASSEALDVVEDAVS